MPKTRYGPVMPMVSGRVSHFMIRKTTATYLGESYGGIAWGSLRHMWVPDTLLWSSSGDMVGTCSCAADKHGVIWL